MKRRSFASIVFGLLSGISLIACSSENATTDRVTVTLPTFLGSSVLPSLPKQRKNHKKYICSWEECRKELSGRTSLKNHMSIHTGDRPFICDCCDKRFITKQQLASHANKHLKNLDLDLDPAKQAIKEVQNSLLCAIKAFQTETDPRKHLTEADTQLGQVEAHLAHVSSALVFARSCLHPSVKRKFSETKFEEAVCNSISMSDDWWLQPDITLQ